jgi:hypothetical protein
MNIRILIALFLLGVCGVSVGAKVCEKFDQELCNYVTGKTSTEGKEIRVIVHAEGDISKELEEISRIEISEVYQGKYLFQISILDSKIKNLEEISEVSYVRMPMKPVFEAKEERISLLALAITGLTLLILIWRFKK